MDEAEMIAKIKAFLMESFPGSGAEPTPDTDLLTGWFVDSFRIVETILFLETTFNIQLNRADIQGENFQTLTTLARFVADRLPASR
ncbi:MAG: acyl carrier protein [Magnetococcales bacterium]|nr:acyl carrier protein [Magnetococcales bacterium]